jgi:peptidoglycan-N-acetylmuramic acid deacetylase
VLTDNEIILRDELGLEMSKFYRPPEGTFAEENLEFASKLGYSTVFWSLAYADWDNDNQPSPEKALTLLKSRIHPGCVLLLQPTSKTNAAILDPLISTLKNEGYIFKSLEEFPN